MPRIPILGFFALAYALSWLAWLPLVAAARGWIDVAPSPYLHLLGGLGPAVAAAILIGRRGRPALVRWLRAAVTAPPRWIAIAIGGPLAIYLAAAAALTLAGYSLDLSATGRSLEYPALGVAGYAVASVIGYGFGEELGWRGYALPRLAARRSSVRATLYLAGAWALWHLPLFAFSSGMASMGPAEILGWASSIVTGAFLLTAIFHASGDRVLVVALFHGALDVLIGSPTGGPLQITMGAIATVAGIAAIPVVVAHDRRRTHSG